jgi:hypothetical protein
LWEDHRLRVFENSVLRRIFGSKRDEVIGEWRRPHNEELCDRHSSSDIIDRIKKNEMGGACSACCRQERCLQSFGRET